MSVLCIAETTGGKGGVAGGAGANGQASQSAEGSGSSSYGYPVLECTTGLTTTLSVQLTKTTDGDIPSDMTGITGVVFIARPTMRGDSSEEIRIPCTFDQDGVVTLTLSPAHVNNHDGLWYAEFMAYAGESAVRAYRAYLCIRRGMEGSTSDTHPITPMDVRLALMDTSAESNELLDDLEFSDMMILNAVERAIDEWEETPPRLSKRFNATNFPFREHLIKGAVGYLLQSISYRYLRNRMQYSAGGVSFDKNDKGAVYIQLAQAARAEWKAFIASMKTSMNMDECFGVYAQPWF